MTVAQLKAELEKYPDEALVFVRVDRALGEPCEASLCQPMDVGANEIVIRE